MKNWINEIKSFFERKPTTNQCTKLQKSESNGVLKERIKFFEGLQAMNAESTESGKGDVSRNRRQDSSSSAPDYSNIERTPSMIMDNDGMCIYDSKDEIVYGSFKKRPKYQMQERLEESEVIIRLKVRESEHLGVDRYESMLKAPLSQQLVVSKYGNKSINPPVDPEIPRVVSSMIDKWNKQCLSNIEKENLIDVALLNSIRKTKITKSSPNKTGKILQMLENNRALQWISMDLVRSGNFADRLSNDEIVFQESQFELISSEASYYRSLNVLVDKFYKSPLLSVDPHADNDPKKFQFKPHQKEHLFSNILQIQSTSGKFLADLEKRFVESIFMKDICDIVTRYASDHFNVYIPYIQNQKFQTKAYDELKKNEKASAVIEELENQPECCSLNLDSFLLLPMQRLLRILLLLKTIKKNIPEGFRASVESADKAITAMETIINQCSLKKDHMDERQRMLEISQSLIFKSDKTILAISSGTLLHEGKVKCHRKTPGPRYYLTSMRNPIFDAWIILTDQYLLISKVIRSKKLSYLVEDWSPIADVSVERIPSVENVEDGILLEFSVNFRNSAKGYVIQTKSRANYIKWISELSICPEMTTSTAQPQEKITT